MTNKEKFLALVTDDVNNTLDYLRERIEKRAQLHESAHIAWKVLDRLDELGWSQKELANKMDVSPQQVNKIVKGQENLTLATIVKLQDILNIPLLASYYEKTKENLVSQADSFTQRLDKQQTKIIQLLNYQQSVRVSSSVMTAEEPLAAYETYTLQA